MFGLFNDVKAVIKLDKICIDNNIFRLHYKATFVILLTASILVTAKQYMGEEGMELNFRHKLEETTILWVYGLRCKKFFFNSCMI